MSRPNFFRQRNFRSFHSCPSLFSARSGVVIVFSFPSTLSSSQAPYRRIAASRFPPPEGSAPPSLLPPDEPHVAPRRRLSPSKDPLHGQRWHFSSWSQHARPLVRESTLRPDPAKVCAAADFEFPSKETALTEAPVPPAWFNLHEPARPDVQNTSYEEGAISLPLYPHHLQVVLFCLRRHGSRTLHQQRREDQRYRSMRTILIPAICCC